MRECALREYVRVRIRKCCTRVRLRVALVRAFSIRASPWRLLVPSFVAVMASPFTFVARVRVEARALCAVLPGGRGGAISRSFVACRELRVRRSPALQRCPERFALCVTRGTSLATATHATKPSTHTSTRHMPHPFPTLTSMRHTAQRAHHTRKHTYHCMQPSFTFPQPVSVVLPEHLRPVPPARCPRHRSRV